MKSFLSLPEKLKESAVKFAGLIAVEIKEGGACRSYTYGEFYERMYKIASFLFTAGMKKGDRAAIILEKRPVCYMP